MANNVLSMKDAKRFVTAGKAFVTISNGRGEHFTFKIVEWKRRDNDSRQTKRFSVAVLVAPDNEKDYAPLGILYTSTWTLYPSSRPDAVTSTSKQFKVAEWMFSHIAKEQEFSGKSSGYSLRHDGRCGRCALKLTTPESIDTGYGPECASVMGVEWKESPIDTETPGMLPFPSLEHPEAGGV